MDGVVVLVALGIWIGGAYALAVFAEKRGRHKVGWFITGLASYTFTILGLLIAFVILAVIGESEEKRTERALMAARMAAR